MVWQLKIDIDLLQRAAWQWLELPFLSKSKMLDLHLPISLKFCLKDGKEGEEKARDERINQFPTAAGEKTRPILRTNHSRRVYVDHVKQPENGPDLPFKSISCRITTSSVVIWSTFGGWWLPSSHQKDRQSECLHVSFESGEIQINDNIHYIVVEESPNGTTSAYLFKSGGLI